MKDKLKKYLLPNLLYLFFVYLIDKLCQAARLVPGLDASEKLLHIGQGFQTAFASSAPSFHALDICVGILGAVFVRLAVYVKGKNAKKYRKGIEYGSARWGTAADIAPYIDPVPDWNIPLTRTESLTMTSRPKQPKYARNKNILVIGGSGSGRTRFFVKPSIMQMHSSYVITDPKGQLLKETGKMLLHGAPKLDENGKPVRDGRGKVIYEPYHIKVLNTINFSKSMKYNPLAYVRSEKDILKLVNVIIANTKGDGEKSSEDFWVKAERLLYCALIGYIWYEAEPEERNFITLLDLLNACEAREDDETYKSPVDILFDDLAKKQPEHFAVKQYVKFKMAAGVVCSKRLLNQAVGKSLRTHNLKPKKGAQVMRKNEKITALYERLSRDDFGKDDDQQRESNSISNQKAMLEEFAARQGFTNIVHFTDDGIGLGNGMTNYMEDSFASMGTNSLTVMVTGRGTSRSISEQEMYAIVADNPDYLDQISPTVTMQGVVKIGTETYRSTSATGVSEEYFGMKGYEIEQGRGLQYLDIADRKAVCVVGRYVADTYYGGNAVGQYIRIGMNRFQIVGVMAQEADTMDEGGTDDCVFLPYSTAARLSSVGTISSYTITVKDEEQIAQAKQVIEDALYDVFADSDAYSIISMSEMLDMMTSMVNIMIYVLAFIAGISLVVGGIGIMNIMLVSVTERTREIGIRKALGAKEGVILRQFVMEAAATSVLGGVLGIAAGYLLSTAASAVIKALLDTPLQVTPTIGSILLSVGVSAGIGILFGYLPAKKAARLNPIDALRYD